MRTELYWIEGSWPGRLAIMPRPRGGDWLEDEVSSWRRLGIDTIVSALSSEEIAELDLIQEKEHCEKVGIEFLTFPVVDRGVPRSAKETWELVRQLEEKLAQGKKIAVHCRQGVGRAALLAACILAVSGVDPASAWDRITVARGCVVPDTAEQREWVVRFARTALETVAHAQSASVNDSRTNSPGDES